MFVFKEYIIYSGEILSEEVLLEGLFTLYPQKKSSLVQLTNKCITIKNSNISTNIINLKDVVGKLSFNKLI